MFRDREKALQALQDQLLEEEENTLGEEDTDDLPAEVYDDYTQDVNAYNSDTADADLEDYSQQVYEGDRRKSGCVLWLILLTAAVLLALSWLLAKQGGLL